MLIDWFTVAAQVINFLILVALLKYFLYGRILQAMDERERTIANRLDAAAAKHREAEGEVEKHRKQLAAFETERDHLLAQAKAEAEARRIDLVQEAREEADRLRAVWQEAVQQETARFLQDLRQYTATQVCAIARRALQDLATVDLEAQIIEVFLEDLRNLDEERASTLINVIHEGGKVLTVHSAFAIPEKTHRKITHALRERLIDDVEVRFTTMPELMCGVAVEARGQKIVWSLEHYLDALEQNIAVLLAEKTQRDMSEDERQAERDEGNLSIPQTEEATRQQEERRSRNATEESRESGS